MSWAYELLDNIKNEAKTIKDSLSGKSTYEAIEDELKKARQIGSPILEPNIVLEALRIRNRVAAFGLSDEEINTAIIEYLKKGYEL